MFAATGSIATFAGRGTAGSTGDGGLAAFAELKMPDGLGMLSDGSVLIADTASHRVRVVWPNNTIDTWMGNGSPSSLGDALHRSLALLNRPWKLSVHPTTDVVFVTEFNSGRIRRVDGQTGIVSLFVGPPGSNATVELAISEPHDVTAVPGTTDAFVVSASGTGRIFYINAASRTAMLIAGTGSSSGFNGNNIAAILATVPRASGVLFHAASQSVLVADNGNGLLRAFSIGANISTLAGSGIGSIYLSAPSGLAWHPSNSIVVSEYSRNRVQVVSEGCLPTFTPVRLRFWAQLSSALSDKSRFSLEACLTRACCFSFTLQSVLWSLTHSHMQRPSPSPTPSPRACYVSTIAGNGSRGLIGSGAAADEAAVDTPAAVAFLPGTGDLLIGSEFHPTVRIVLAATGTIATFAGKGVSGFDGDGDFAPLATLWPPSGVAVLHDSSVLITQEAYHRVRQVLPNNTIVTWMGDGNPASTGDGLHRLGAAVAEPWKVFVHPITRDVFISERRTGRVRRVDGANGAVSTLLGPEGSNATIVLPLSEVHDVLPVPGTRNMLIVSSTGSHRVFLVNMASRTVMLLAGSDASGSAGDNAAASTAQLSGPRGLAFHSTAGSVIVASFADSRIRAFTIGGKISTIAGMSVPSASLVNPSGFAWHPAGAGLVVSQVWDQRVSLIAPGCFPPAIQVCRARPSNDCAVGTFFFSIFTIGFLSRCTWCRSLRHTRHLNQTRATRASSRGTDLPASLGMVDSQAPPA